MPSRGRFVRLPHETTVVAGRFGRFVTVAHVSADPEPHMRSECVLGTRSVVRGGHGGTIGSERGGTRYETFFVRRDTKSTSTYSPRCSGEA